MEQQLNNNQVNVKIMKNDINKTKKLTLFQKIY